MTKNKRRYSWDKEPDEEQSSLELETEVKKEEKVNPLLDVFKAHAETKKEPLQKKTEEPKPEEKKEETEQSGTKKEPEKNAKNESGLTEDEQEELSASIIKIINPKLIIKFFDNVFTRVLCKLASFIDYKIDRKKIRLTEQEVKDLEPSVKFWMKTWKLNLSPLMAVTIAFGFTYGSKIFDAAEDVEEDKPKRKPTPRKTTARTSRTTKSGKPDRRGRPRKNIVPVDFSQS